MSIFLLSDETPCIALIGMGSSAVRPKWVMRLSEWPSNPGGRNTAIGFPCEFGFAEENFRRDVQSVILVYQQFENWT